MLRFALPILTVILSGSVFLITINPAWSIIAAILPNSFFLGYIFEKIEINEKNNKNEEDKNEKNI